jgi:hypothetical protein
MRSFVMMSWIPGKNLAARLAATSGFAERFGGSING